MTSIRDDVAKYIKKKYKATPEYLWRSYPDYAVFRHDDNRKWFAIIMDVDTDKLGLPGTERMDIIDVKIDDLMLRDILLQQHGYLPAYHMNKGSWITVRRHIVGGTNRALISVETPIRLCRIGTCRRLSAGLPQIVVALFEEQLCCF